MAFGSVFNLSSLNGSNGFTINGTSVDDYSGKTVSNAGDFNGDGIDDVAIATYRTNSNDNHFARQICIVFGTSNGFASSLNLSSLNGSNGFTLNESIFSTDSGFSVSNAGDVNGDGIDDVAIGASSADPNGYNFAAGQTYIVFGKSNRLSSQLNLGSLNGSNGFIINGIKANDYSGGSVSNAGDVNGDGIDDVAIGADGADPNGKDNAGQTYMVFGTSQGFAQSLNLSSLNGSNGFTINGINSSDRSGASISNAGDVNGDGIDDVAIGADDADPNGKNNAGQTYIIFGTSNGFAKNLNLSSLNGSNGFTINGINSFDESGGSVSNVGDVNGDGIDDVAIGAKGADPNGNNRAGQTYIVFGTSQGFAKSLNLSSLNGSNGFTINGINEYDESGFSVSNAGDVNADGITDVAIGARYADPNGKISAGQTYIAFGKSNGFASNLNLSTLNGSNGFTINGSNTFDFSGNSVSNAGDVNGDGIDDVAIGAQYAESNNGNAYAGQTYIVFGQASTTPPPGPINGDNTNNLLNGTPQKNIINGFGGNDTLFGLGGDDTLNGGNDKDSLNGGNDNDSLNGGAGNDTLIGSGGLDTLNGSTGNDLLIGGEGRDTYLIDNSLDVIQETVTITNQIDTVQASITVSLGANLENLILTGSNALNGTGNSLNNSITGNSGKNNLNGNAGNDTLTGGIGIDNFSYRTGKTFSKADVGIDKITDFTHNSDKIILSKITFKSISSQIGTGFSNTSEFDDVTTDANAATSAADIVYNSSNGKLFYNQNGVTAGFGTGAQFTVLTGSPTVDSGDFVIVA